MELSPQKTILFKYPKHGELQNDDLLFASLENAKKELELASNNFEFADTEELVDFYTYQIKAAQLKYQYLLKKLKSLGFTRSYRIMFKNYK